MIFELSRKTLKDYLESEGFIDLASPRRVIKQAFESAYLKNGKLWILALVDRNLSAHIYDEEKISKITQRIEEQYFELFLGLKQMFENIS